MDVAIRSGDLADSRPGGAAPGAFHFVLVGLTGLPGATWRAEGAGGPRTPRRPRCSRPGARSWTGPVRPPTQLPPRLLANHIEAMLGAALEGIGVAYMPDFLVRDRGRGD